MNPREIEAQMQGYGWALSQERFSEYNEFASHAAFIAACEPSGNDHSSLWEAWGNGVWDSKQVLDYGKMLSVAEVAALAKCGKAYVQAEIKRGTLYAQILSGNAYSVFPSDFAAWMNNPQRGRASKSRKKP